MKKKIEALLFSSATPLTEEDIARALGCSEGDAAEALRQLAQEFAARDAPFVLERSSEGWYVAVKPELRSVLKKIAAKAEMPKSVLKTLAVIAHLAPAKQSDVIKIRNNKAYGHIKLLEKAELIVSEKAGRSRLLKLAPRFYEYFSIDPSRLKAKFEKRIALLDRHGCKRYLETYGKLDELEVFEERPAEAAPEEKVPEEKERRAVGLFPTGIPEELKEKIEKRVREIVSGEEK